MIEELRRIDVEAVTRALAIEVRDLAARLTADGAVTEITGSGCFVGLGLQNADGTGLSGPQVLEVVSAIARCGVLVQPGPSSIELIPAYGFDASELRETESAVRAGLAHVRGAAA